jgi:hypothetical protein
MSETVDERILHRQAHCSHRFIKPWPDSVERCVHCGVSAKDWEAAQLKQALAFPWGGVP